MFRLRGFLVFLFALVFATNTFSQEYIGSKKELDKIFKNIENFSQYYMNGEAEKLAASYTKDGKIFPNRRDIIEGTSGLQQYWTLPKGVKVLHHKVTPSEIRIVEDFAHDYGYYEGTTQSPDGTKSDFKGKYVIVWQKVGDDWKIYLDMWNSLD